MLLFLGGSLLMAQAPTLGAYPNTSVFAGKNTTLTPSAAPTNATYSIATTNTRFTGLLTVDPTTGVVSVTDALQAGVYPVTVKAMNGTLSTTATFTLTVTPPACSQGTFAGPTNVATGNYPNAMAIGDFNRDGIQDIVATNYNQSSVAVKLGNGTGNFGGATVIPVGAEPTAIAVGDFNGDGKQDFVSVSIADNTVSVRLGDGLGGFTGITDLALGGGMQPTGVAVGDFNEDGFADIAGTDGLNDQAFIRLGDGLGGFTAAANVSVDFTPSGIVVADFNEDGHQDIATANFGSTTVSIRLGNGLGGFTGTLDAFAGSQGPQAMAIGDFNEDGHQDFVATNDAANKATIRLGDGLGGFVGTTNVFINFTPNGVAVGDFNGDGHQDFITANAGSSNAALRLGDGAGNFVNGGNLATGGGPFTVLVGNFNSDDVQDVAISSGTAGNLSIYLGAGNEIDVQGNAIGIADGDLTPSLTDFTDFGSVGVGSPIARTFTIRNFGTDALNLGNGAITLSGPDAAMFALSGITLPATLAGGASTTFTLTFTPTVAGIKSATLTIANDDCNEAVYDFAIQGTGSACTAAVFSVCPSAINTTNDPGTCAAVVNYTATETGTAPVALTYTITGATTLSGSGTGSGATFNVGTSNVSITATNACGSATCAFTITIADNQLPTATCQNVTLTLDGSGNATLNASAVNNGSTDNCTLATVTVAPSAFNCTNVGSPVPPSIWINEIHYDNLATDVGEFIELAGTAGINLANYAIVRYNGSVPGAAVIYTTPAQTTVLTGTIPNQSNGYGTFAVFFPQDGLQNGTSDGFALVNTVTNTVVQLLSYEGVFTAGPGQGLASGMVSTNLPVSEPGSITGGSIRLAGTGNTYSSFAWQVQAAPASPGAINAGQVMSPAGGAVATLTVTDASANTATCTAQITILDSQVPVIVCPANITVSAAIAACSEVVTYTAPVGTDNCTPVTTQTTGLASGATFPIGLTTNTFSVSDGHANTATCTFTVTVTDTELPAITCPTAVTASNDPGICGAAVSYFAPLSTDNCPGVTTLQTTGLASNATFPVGVTTNAFIANDAAGNTATCTFTVTVSDSESPTWTACPGNLTVSSSATTCDAVVTWTAPTAADNCSVAGSSSSHAPGSTFALGTTLVTYTTSDPAGNTGTCSFAVTVDDSISPVATCQAVSLTLDSLGNASLTAAALDNGSSDNCGIDSISINLSAFGCAQVGSNTVILTVTDMSGNTATCASTVTLTAPALVGSALADTTTCGYNITCPGGNDGVAHALGGGGCPGYTYLWSSGATTSTVTGLSAGTHTVTITDASGGTSVQTITLVAPAAIQLTGSNSASCFNDSTGTASVSATGGNGCSGYSYLWNTGETANAIAGLTAGNYTVTVTDGASCTSSVAVTVAALPALNPTFTVAGDDLSATQTWATYQWLLNGAPINGATANTYNATTSGSYALQVTDTNGCSGISASSTVVGITATAFASGMQLYPNPATDQVRLRTKSPLFEPVTICLYDQLGHRLHIRALPELTSDLTIDLKGYAKGMYLIEIVNAQGQRRAMRLVVE